MSTIARLLPFEVISQADQLAPYIQEAAAGSNGKFLGVDIARLLARGEWQLWTAREAGQLKAVLMTRIVFYPQLKACQLLAAVGEERDANMLPFMPDIEAWAKSQGCTLMEPIARAGWDRVLKPLGFVRTHVMLEKRI